MLSVLFAMYRDAGGFKFVFGTIYLYLAIFLSFIFLDRSYQANWPEMAINIFPSLVGFSLATFAIVLAIFGSENIAKLSAKKDGQKVSPLAKLTALIVHAALVQITALIIAFGLKQDGMCKSTWSDCGWESVPLFFCENVDIRSELYVLGLFLTIYGLLLIFSTLLAVFQTSKLTR